MYYQDIKIKVPIQCAEDNIFCLVVPSKKDFRVYGWGMIIDHVERRYYIGKITLEYPQPEDEDEEEAYKNRYDDFRIDNVIDLWNYNKFNYDVFIHIFEFMNNSFHEVDMIGD